MVATIPTSMTVEQLKTLIWRYFISYWNNQEDLLC